jgi:DNA invertase Pin-like site-specific DNA recombinase
LRLAHSFDHSVGSGEDTHQAACKRAKLVIAKLDRLSRNVAFLAALMDRGVDFVACDNPHANKLTCN